TYADKKEDTFNKEITGSLNNEICDGTKLTTRGKLYLQEFGSRNAALAMALNMSGLVYYQDVNAQSLIEGKISAMLISTIFSLLMYLIYAASFIALFIVLLARLVVLWISIVASPIILIGMAIPTVKEKGGFGELIDKFVQEAIAPIGIAFAMTVGWIMLRAMQSISPISSDITLQFDPTKGIPVVGLNTLQDLMVAVGTLGVIWLAVFTAASKSVAAPVTEMIKGGLLTAGKFIGNLPLRHLNLIPVQVGEKGEEKKYTFSQVGEFFHELGREDYNKKRKLVSDLLPGRAHSDLRVLGEKSVTKTKEDAYTILRQNQDKLRKGGDETTKAIREFKVRNDRVYNEIVRDHPDVKKELDTITTSGDQAEIDKALKRLAELP
ncbi:hypothetical protein HZC20_01645, partial [Candidatus Peregrinibacteria bacterium]|nr:hypothetical protein [Candidatus Peregrinibacteria bacterium]